MSPTGRTHRCDVAIAGGGPVGLTLALALAQRGFSVAAADRGAFSRGGDTRAYFIAYGCWRIFRALGLEEALRPMAEPVTQVEAKGGPGGIAFFAEDVGEPELGYMIEASRLSHVLTEAVKRESAVTLFPEASVGGAEFGAAHATLKLGGADVEASLIVGCDGRHSMVRKAAGLRVEGHDYDAEAISTTIALSRPHHGAARQKFLPTGPIAALPLKGDRANLIWTVTRGRAEALVTMADTDFERELGKQAGDFAPGARLAGGRFAYPLGVHVAERFDAPRVALGGDAAHIVHPLGGQGLNLGLKDVAALVDVIVESARVGLDIGAAGALAPYTRWRRPDVVATAAAMEAFARAFTAPLPVRMAAGAGLALAAATPGLRRMFTREGGGDLGEMPSLMARETPR